MVQITVNQQVSGQVQAQDRKGKPAPVESGTVSYTSSNEEVFTVEEDETDETKFKVLAQGAGAAELRISADADLGTGVETIETFSAVEIIPEKAVGFGITFGTPEDKPEPPVEE